MSTGEVAKRLGVSPTRVKQLRNAGRLKPRLETNIGFFYLPEDVEAFAKTRTVSTTREIVAEAQHLTRQHEEEDL